MKVDHRLPTFFISCIGVIGCSSTDHVQREGVDLGPQLLVVLSDSTWNSEDRTVRLRMRITNSGPDTWLYNPFMDLSVPLSARFLIETVDRGTFDAFQLHTTHVRALERKHWTYLPSRSSIEVPLVAQILDCEKAPRFARIELLRSILCRPPDEFPTSPSMIADGTRFVLTGLNDTEVLATSNRVRIR
jgi:hypothetical protein